MDEQSPYDKLGGDAGVRALVDRFYDAMEERPDASELRALHPDDMTGSRDLLYWFLSGWLGGPQMYVERKGHPRLRARHLPFRIDSAMAVAWMACMQQALEPVEDEALVSRLMESLTRVAAHMRNTADDPG